MIIYNSCILKRILYIGNAVNFAYIDHYSRYNITTRFRKHVKYYWFKLTLTFRRCRTPFAVVIALQCVNANQFVTGVAVVFDARVNIEVIANYITSGRHLGLLTRDHCRSKITTNDFYFLINNILNIKTRAFNY